MATFEELTGMPVTQEPVERPLETIHQSGADTRRAEGERMQTLEKDTTLGDTFGAAWERNISTMMYDTVERKWTHQPEEGFDPAQWVNENRDSLPGQNLEAFSSVRSVGEANELRDDMVRAQENDMKISSKGYTGVAASLLTGLIDPTELAIAVGTGGYGKAATMAGRVGKITVAGAKGGVASAVTAYGVDPLADTKQIVYGGLTGALLSGTAGVAFNRSTGALRRNYSVDVSDLPPANRSYTEAPAYVYTDMADNPQSLGAGSMNEFVDPDGFSPETRSIYDQSMQTIRDNNLGSRLEDTDMNTSTAAGRTAKRFSDTLSNNAHYNPFKTDFDQLAYGGSRIEAALAYNLLESAEGRLRNNRSGAMLQEVYEQRLSSHSLPTLDEGFSTWAAKRNLGVLQRNAPAAREAFDREIITELEARFHTGKAVSKDPAIVQAADAVDRNYADAVEVGKGRTGETSVSGFEDMQPQSGFFNHRWNGSAIRRAMAAGHDEAKILNLLKTGYAKTYPDMDDASSTMISKAVLRRAIAKEDGVDTNMLNTLDSDAQEYLREMLTDSGYSEQHVDRLIDSIRGRKEDQSKLGTTKARVQVDLRTADGDLSLMDLVDTNLTRVLSRYNREVSGNAALARKGIQNRAQRKQMIEAALAERRSRDLPAGEAERRRLEDIFTYFDSGPIGGGVDPWVSRAKRVTNLALLNQMGLTQAGEAGAQIAAVGMDTWKRHAGQVFKQMRAQGPDGPIIQELRPFMGRVGEDHLLFRDDLMLDEMSTARDLNTFLGKLDFGLGKGQRLQGYVSGFYHVKSFQQKVAVASMSDKVMQRLRDGADKEILDGIGMPQRLKKYIDNGTVEFKDGHLDKLNLDRWSPADAEDFSLAINRHTHQVVQKSLAGEESMWMHKSVGSMYMHLKSFPMLAMRKQSARLAGVQTPLAVSTLMMGLATAGLAYEAKQLINGRTERISGEDALRGALGMSNMTGWVPMLTDPAAAILGMNDLRFNQYGRHQIDSGIIAMPPAIPTLNKMAHLPGAVNPWADLSDNERIRIMQSTPIVGNLYGFSALFNSMKD